MLQPAQLPGGRLRGRAEIDDFHLPARHCQVPAYERRVNIFVVVAPPKGERRPKEHQPIAAGRLVHGDLPLRCVAAQPLAVGVVGDAELIGTMAVREIRQHAIIAVGLRPVEG